MSVELKSGQLQLHGRIQHLIISKRVTLHFEMPLFWLNGSYVAFVHHLDFLLEDSDNLSNGTKVDS